MLRSLLDWRDCSDSTEYQSGTAPRLLSARNSGTIESAERFESVVGLC
jgi:hypothetical protein